MSLLLTKTSLMHHKVYTMAFSNSIYIPLSFQSLVSKKQFSFQSLVSTKQFSFQSLVSTNSFLFNPWCLQTVLFSILGVYKQFSFQSLVSKKQLNYIWNIEVCHCNFCHFIFSNEIAPFICNPATYLWLSISVSNFALQFCHL